MLQETQIDKIKKEFDTFIISPASKFGIGGLIFDIEGSTKSDLSASITDHYVEDNTAVQDHMAISPEKIILRGYVGDLFFRKEISPISDTQLFIQKLVTFTAYAPQLSAAEEQFREEKEEDEGTNSQNENIDNLLNLFELTINLNPGASNQQKIYLYLKSLIQQKINMSLLTPYGFIKNLFVESIVSLQKEESKSISEFTVTLKKLRFASLSIVPFDESDFQGRAKQQRQPVVNNGKGNGKDIPSSVLFDIITGSN